MDNHQGEAPHMSSIPKRPSKPSDGKQSFSKRSFSPHRPVESISTGNIEQQSSSSLPDHRHDSIQSKKPKEEDNRSLLSEIATIKSVTVQPQTAESLRPPKYPERKNRTIQYSVTVQPQTAESLRPPRYPERKNRTVQYTAAVNPGKVKKQGFLVWVASLGFLNLKSM